MKSAGNRGVVHDRLQVLHVHVFLAAPQCLRDVLHPAHGNACQVHLDEGLRHAALPAVIPLDDGGLEGHALEPGHMERDVAGSRGEVAVIVAAAVAPDGPRCARSG